MFHNLGLDYPGNNEIMELICEHAGDVGVYLFLHLSSIILQPYLNNPYWWMLLNAGFILELSVLLYGVQILITKAINLLIVKFKKKEVKVNA